MSARRLLSFTELAEHVSRMTYRPGWELSVFEDRHLGPHLRIVARVQDGYNPGRSIDLGICARIPPCAREDAEHLAGWVLWRLEEAEIHECREMLRYDGKLVDDPHA